MENKRSSTQHVVIIIGVFIIALAFRLIRLGALSLNDLEAQLALQALAVARGEQTLFAGVHAYVGLTSLPLFLFSASNFMARFWPAVIGAAIVFIPLMFSKYIGRWPAIMAAVVLAISPEMVGLARTIGSPMMALVFTLLAAGFWLGGKPILAGISLGLGLMGGPSFWVGVVIISLSLVLSDGLFGILDIFQQGSGDESPPLMWARFGISLALTLVVVGSGFFMAPSGLSGTFSGLVAFIIGFGKTGVVPLGWIPFMLLVYGTGAVVFGLWGGIRGILIKSKLDMFLIMWAGLGLVFIILYPGAGAAEVIWVTFPLWMLSARVVLFAWRKPESSKLVVAITTVLVVVIAAFMALAMRTLVTPILSQSQQLNYLIALVGGAVLKVAIILLVNYGWSEDIARSGLLLGLGLVLFAGMISVSVNSTGIGLGTPFELWYPDEAVLLPEWTQVTIDRTLAWNARGAKSVDILVSELDTPGLRWVMRSYDRVVFEAFVPPQSQPGMIITPVGTIPEISQSYQGQSLVWMRSVPWRELTPSQYLTWLVSRDVPTIPQELILWVRTDLMPGGQIVD
jgi:hypothetical protein